jgi:hypothetical protein
MYPFLELPLKKQEKKVSGQALTLEEI